MSEPGDGGREGAGKVEAKEQEKKKESGEARSEAGSPNRQKNGAGFSGFVHAWFELQGQPMSRFHWKLAGWLAAFVAWLVWRAAGWMERTLPRADASWGALEEGGMGR